MKNIVQSKLKTYTILIVVVIIYKIKRTKKLMR